ncbi:ABC transporter permease [Candidatus Dependentiae bacterium]|nr:ABC transporter permease [Candidatus Dependentiae bacterium]
MISKLKEFIENTGELSLLTLKAIKLIFVRPFRFKIIIDQMMMLGIKSIPIVLVTGFFSGMVMAYQVTMQLRKFGAEIYVGGITSLALARELAPVFTALMVAGRVSSGITAELGSMRATEQIDALETLAINPIHYLISPRLVATFIMMPVLTFFADIVGFFGAYLVSVIKMNINGALFIDRTLYIVEASDVLSGISKSFFFAVIIAMVGCYCGFTSKGGAAGVGKSTLISVVTSCILIFIVDYLLTAIFYSL